MQERRDFVVWIQFDEQRATIAAADEARLDEVASIMKFNARLFRATIRGSHDVNEAALLAKLRAKAVHAALVRRGVTPSRLVTSARPAASDSGKDAHQERDAENRRVEVLVLERRISE